MSATIDIRALRKARCWSQEQMAEYLGVDRSTVSRLENGQEPQGPVRRLLALLSTKTAPAPSDPEIAPVSETSPSSREVAA